MRDARAILVPALILLVGWLASDSDAGAGASLTLARHFTPAWARYQYVPFDVLPEAASHAADPALVAITNPVYLVKQ